ncbi:MAG: hypothetical protein CMP23_03275 [Rickettsiales bacterium]|nr:hypothetical protein [Rickettsiales bacterium]
MPRPQRAALVIFFSLTLLPFTVHGAEGEALDPVLAALELELERSQQLLAEKELKPYFIGLEAVEVQRVSISAEEGGLHGYRPDRRRWVHADVRLGTPELDSTHPLRDSDADYSGSGGVLGIGEDVGVLRRRIWEEVERRYREARERLQQVEADRQVLVEEENRALDLAPVEIHEDLGSAATLDGLDRVALEDSIRQASAIFSASSSALDPSVSVAAEAYTQWFVSTEGQRIRHSNVYYRMSLVADSIAPGGDRIQLSESVDSSRPEGLPGTADLVAAARRLDERLMALVAAQREDPYSGPAILSGRAAAVFFHEIFGHRVEGSRLKQVDSGQTFLNKVGDSILPAFISVHDDPTLKSAEGIDLRGSYAYDNQGVRSSRVALVENGVLKGFLESRSPSTEGRTSNAHGRRQPLRAVVARQGNLLVTAHQSVSEKQLREQLRQRARQAGLEYGLYIDDISGGFTFTGTYMPNAYQINVLLAHRVYVDGRPDELVRGIDFIGTPLQTFSNIIAAGDQREVFNGSCGAESGWVPVSAVAPSMLVAQVEAQRQMKGQAKSPLLPPPPATEEGSGDRLLGQLSAAVTRATEELTLPGAPRPAWTEVSVRDFDQHRAVAEFGALVSESGAPSRPANLEVVVGDQKLNSSRISGGSITTLPQSGVAARLVVEDLGENVPRDFWLIADISFKAALQRLAFKASARAQVVGEEPPPDLSPAPVVQHLAGRAHAAIPRGHLNQIATQTSAKLRDLGLHNGSVSARTIRGNEYLVRSDGTQVVQPYGYTVVWAAAAAVRGDGLRVGMTRQWLARTEEQLPGIEQLGAEVRRMGEALKHRMQASEVPYYEGPVLFEGAAAAQLLVQLLAPSLRGTPPVPQPGRSYQQQTRRGPRLNRKVLPAGWRVSDDPRRRHEQLPGGYDYDQEGVQAEPVELVRDGRVVDFVMSRVPRSELAGSNGHARGGLGGQLAGRLADWSVVPGRGLSSRAMDRALARAQRSAGLERVLVIRALDRSSAGRLGRVSEAVWRYGDGREEPVLALEFLGVDRRSLRDIVAASAEQQTYGYLASTSAGGKIGSTSGMPTVIRAPRGLLLEQLELAYPGSSQKPFAIPPPPLLAEQDGS